MNLFNTAARRQRKRAKKIREHKEENFRMSRLPASRIKPQLLEIGSCPKPRPEKDLQSILETFKDYMAEELNYPFETFPQRCAVKAKHSRHNQYEGCYYFYSRTSGWYLLEPSSRKIYFCDSRMFNIMIIH